MTQTFRIYALTEPDGITPRYVGQTAAVLMDRLRDHLRAHGTSARTDWLRSILAAHQEPGTLLEEVIGNRHDAYARETHWIKRLRAEGQHLLNVP